MSRALLLPPRPLGDELRPAVEAIDRVHGDGILAQLVIVPDGNLEADAAYEVITLTGEPYRIAINPAASTPAFSLVHEVGHFLLHTAIPRHRLVGSANRDETSSTFWYDAVQKSERVQTLQELASLTSKSAVNARMVYELKVVELWARSYAQYITLRGDNARLKQQMKQRRLGLVGGMPVPIQWGESDFTEIAESIDDVMRLEGWIG